MVSTTMCPLRCGACVQQPVYRRHSLWAPFFRGLHRLAVDDGRAGRGFPSGGFPNPGTQGLPYPLPSPIISPLPKVPPDRAPRWQVVGHQPPGYAAPQHVQDAVDHFPQVHGSGMPQGRVGCAAGALALPIGHRSNRWDKVFCSCSQPNALPALTSRTLDATLDHCHTPSHRRYRWKGNRDM